MKHSILNDLTRGAAALLLLTLPAAAEGWVQMPTLGVGQNLGDGLGSAVAIGDGHAFAARVAPGLVHTYRLEQGAYVAGPVLAAPGGEATSAFGNQLVHSDGRLYVAAMNADGGSTDEGRVHVFERQGDAWELVQSIAAPTPTAHERFGHSLDVDGGWMVVGTLESDDEARAMVFRRYGSTWQHRYTLSNFDSGDMGLCLEVRERESGSVADLFVGRPDAQSQGWNAIGAVDHFALTAIGPIGGPTVQMANPGSNDLFGIALAFDGEQLVVGAENAGSGLYDGRVFVYDFEVDGLAASLDLRHSMSAGQLVDNAKFGGSLALDGDRLAVGTRWADVAGVYRAGSVRTYLRNVHGIWQLEDVLEPGHPEAAGSVGTAVALDGDLVLAGAPNMGGGDWNDFGAGAAILFSLTPQTLQGGVAPTGVLAGFQTYEALGDPVPSLDLAIDAPPVPSETSTLTLSDGQAFALPLLIWGLSPTEVPFFGETLLVNPLVYQVLPLLDPSGTRQVSITVPGDPSLWGAEVFLQAATIHMSPQWGDGIEASNGLALRVGF